MRRASNEEQPSEERLADAGQQLDGLGGLDGTDDPRQTHEHAPFRAMTARGCGGGGSG